MNRTKVIAFINNLKGYEGYVQFSHRVIDVTIDVFKKTEPKVENEEGFILEAHFCNKVESVAIKQINAEWLVSRTLLSNIADKENDIQVYQSIAGDVNMAQIWKFKPDVLCEGMDVMKLDKVVFAGFDKGEAS